MRKLILRLQNIDALIKPGSTGSPPQVANKIGISERSLFEYLRLMKGFRAPIKYSHNDRGYQYQQDGVFVISFKAGNVTAPA